MIVYFVSDTSEYQEHRICFRPLLFLPRSYVVLFPHRHRLSLCRDRLHVNWSTMRADLYRYHEDGTDHHFQHSFARRIFLLLVFKWVFSFVNWKALWLSTIIEVRNTPPFPWNNA